MFSYSFFLHNIQEIWYNMETLHYLRSNVFLEKINRGYHEIFSLYKKLENCMVSVLFDFLLPIIENMYIFPRTIM